MKRLKRLSYTADVGSSEGHFRHSESHISCQWTRRVLVDYSDPVLTFSDGSKVNMLTGQAVAVGPGTLMVTGGHGSRFRVHYWSRQD
jgi:hypothetical protein